MRFHVWQHLQSLVKEDIFKLVENASIHMIHAAGAFMVRYWLSAPERSLRRPEDLERRMHS